jgi:hypothetical protein
LNATLAKSSIAFSWQIKYRDNSGPSILFTLPDVSGERLLHRRSLIANRYYHHSSGMIFLLDADRLMQSDNPGIGTAPDRDPVDHLEVVTAMIEDLEARLEPAFVKAMPIAICVNKLDKLRAYDNRWDQLARDFIPFHDGYFDFATCSLRSEQIRNLLYENQDLAQAVGQIEATFANVMYFMIATIGSDSENVKLMPIAVEDPFLYQLWHLGRVQANSSTVQ